MSDFNGKQYVVLGIYESTLCLCLKQTKVITCTSENKMHGWITYAHITITSDHRKSWHLNVILHFFVGKISTGINSKTAVYHTILCLSPLLTNGCWISSRIRIIVSPRKYEKATASKQAKPKSCLLFSTLY